MSCQITPSPQVLPSPQPIPKPQNSHSSKYARLAAGAVVAGGVVAGALAINYYMRTETPIAPLITEQDVIKASILGGLAGSLTNSGVAAYLLYEDRRFNYTLSYKVNNLARCAVIGILPGIITGISMLGLTRYFPITEEQK